MLPRMLILLALLAAPVIAGQEAAATGGGGSAPVTECVGELERLAAWRALAEFRQRTGQVFQPDSPAPGELTFYPAAGTLYADRKLAAMLSFGVPELALFATLVVPLAAMTSALQMLICTYGRSYREAQTYVSYLATVSSFVPVIVLFSGLKDAFWQLTVPVLAQQMVLSRVLRGDVLAREDYIVPALVSFVLAALCIHAVARLLRQERIVFGRS